MIRIKRPLGMYINSVVVKLVFDCCGDVFFCGGVCIPHPSQKGFKGLSDLLPLGIAPLCNNVNDCVFICSCRHKRRNNMSLKKV